MTEVQQEYRIATQHAEPSLDYTPANDAGDAAADSGGVNRGRLLSGAGQHV